MKLTRVTITGADDAVNSAELVALSREFPFVEWGILRSQKRNEASYTQWAPRYPSGLWRDKFGLRIRDSGIECPVASHLCGELARRAIGGDDRWRWSCALQYHRVQLNGFSKYRVPMLLQADRNPGYEFILQVQHNDALLHASELFDLHPNVSALWDLSGGEGKAITWMPTTGLLPMGFAGGLGPDNVVELARYLTTSSVPMDEPTWIDMESGVRTDDKFDLDKVRCVLERVQPFVKE